MVSMTEATYTTKVSEISSMAIITNFFLPISSTLLVVGKASAVL